MSEKRTQEILGMIASAARATLTGTLANPEHYSIRLMPADCALLEKYMAASNSLRDNFPRASSTAEALQGSPLAQLGKLRASYRRA